MGKRFEEPSHRDVRSAKEILEGVSADLHLYIRCQQYGSATVEKWTEEARHFAAGKTGCCIHRVPDGEWYITFKAEDFARMMGSEGASKDGLSLEAQKAASAGMTYGKYVALQHMKSSEG